MIWGSKVHDKEGLGPRVYEKSGVSKKVVV